MVCVCTRTAKREIKTVIIVRCECVCSFHSSGIDLYSCTYVRTVVGLDIESTHAVHLARVQRCTDDSNYQVLRTIKHGKTFSIWPYGRREQRRRKRLIQQFNVIVKYLTAYHLNRRTYTSIQLHIQRWTCVSERKYWKHHVVFYGWIYLHPFDSNFIFTHISMRIRSLVVFECQSTWPMIMNGWINNTFWLRRSSLEKIDHDMRFRQLEMDIFVHSTSMTCIVGSVRHWCTYMWG